MGGRLGWLDEKLKPLDPWMARAADYWFVCALIVGALLAAGAVLAKAFGLVFLVVAIVIVLLIAAVSVLAFLLRKERLERTAVNAKAGAASESKPGPTSKPKKRPPSPPSSRTATVVTPRSASDRSSVVSSVFGGQPSLHDELQRLYDRGVDLRDGCPTLGRSTLTNLKPRPPTDETDVEAWIRSVDRALEGKARLRNKFSQEFQPAAWTTVSMTTTPMKQRIVHKLGLLETIIETL